MRRIGVLFTVCISMACAGVCFAASKPAANPIPEMDMINIPAGTFLMGNSKVGDDSKYGSPDELPQHSVYLSAYSIGKYEVTRGQYRRFMEAGGYSNKAYWSKEGWKWQETEKRTEPRYWPSEQDWGPGQPFTQTDSHPVVGVSYYEAEAFCKWAGGHLPTEAQWEKAARWDAAKNHPNVYPWGDTWDAEKCNNMNDHNEAGGGYQHNQTTPVGSYPAGASPYGCQDMAGNAGEWCSDGYDGKYYSQTPKGGWKDPLGLPEGYRVVRGAGWYANDNYGRCAFRYYLHPNPFYTYCYGFRLVRDGGSSR